MQSRKCWTKFRFTNTLNTAGSSQCGDCLIYSTIPLGTPVLKFFICFLACVFNSLPVLAMNYLRFLIINHTLNKKAVSSSVHVKLDYWPCARNLKLRGNTRTSCWCSHAIYGFWQTSPRVSITL